MAEPTLDYYPGRPAGPARPTGPAARARTGAVVSLCCLGLFALSMAVSLYFLRAHSYSTQVDIQNLFWRPYATLLLLPVGFGFGLSGFLASRWVPGLRGLGYAILSMVGTIGGGLLILMWFAR